MSSPVDGLAELVDIVERHTEGPASASALPRTTLVRVDHPREAEGEMFVPVVCLVLKGVKHVQFRDRSVTFRPGSFVTSALDFPITGHVAEAPYRAVALHLAPEPLAQVLLAAQAVPPPPVRQHCDGFGVGQASPLLLEAMIRLLRLLDHTEDRPVLAEAAEREVLYRALQTPSGDVIRRFAFEGHLASRVGPAVTWIRENFAEPLSVEDLAARVHLSVSTLYRHFRSATGATPLQLQKQLRLQEARKLLLLGQANAAVAATQVGYASPSQFNRDYVRLFGRTPGHDAAGSRAT